MAVLGYLLAAQLSMMAPGEQSLYHYNAAIVADDYGMHEVLVTVIDTPRQARRRVCVSAGSLLSALRTEHGLDKFSVQSAALLNTPRVFKFSHPEALKLLAVGYTEDDMAEMRQRLSRYTRDELSAGFNGRTEEMKMLTADKEAYGAAALCVLLERGLQVSFRHGSHQLVVE